MLKKFTTLMLGLGLILSACSLTPVQDEALTHIRLPMGYIANIQYAPFYTAIEKGYFKDAGIEIEFDYSFETDGVKLVVDPASLELVRGSAVDFVEDLGGAAFRVTNPNAQSGCGCGSSFSV